MRLLKQMSAVDKVSNEQSSHQIGHWQIVKLCAIVAVCSNRRPAGQRGGVTVAWLLEVGFRN